MRVRVLLLAAVAMLGACGGGLGSNAQPGTTPKATSAATPTATATGTPGQGQLDRCHTSGLSLSTQGPAQGALGSSYQEFGLTNQTGTPCWVYGYVGMALLDAAGNQLPTRVVRDAGSVFPFAHVGQYTVRPGATAPFWVRWGRVPVGSETSCPTSAGLILTPPDETTQLRLNNIQIMACNGGELDVSPVTAPGTTGF